MGEVTVSCGCGRLMRLDPLRGKGSYQCGCGARVEIQVSVEERVVCAAQMKGNACTADPVPGLPVILCTTHADELAQSLLRRVVTDSDDDDLHIDAYKALNTWRQRMPQVRVEEHTAYVYYLRFGHRIKIGTSMRLTERLEVLPHDEMLAIEPGSYNVESKRHEQFARLRIIGEWFHPGEDLLEHIAAVRDQHGDPRNVIGVRRPIDDRRRRLLSPGSPPRIARIDQLITGTEAAKLCHVAPGTIRQWVNRGHLEPVGADERGRRLFNPVDVAKADHKTRRLARRSTPEAVEEEVPDAP